MITAAICAYVIIAICVGLIIFFMLLAEGMDDSTGKLIAVIIAIACGLLIPILIVAAIVISLLPIIIPCVTLIYLFG